MRRPRSSSNSRQWGLVHETRLSSALPIVVSGIAVHTEFFTISMLPAPKQPPNSTGAQISISRPWALRSAFLAVWQRSWEEPMVLQCCTTAAGSNIAARPCAGKRKSRIFFMVIGREKKRGDGGRGGEEGGGGGRDGPGKGMGGLPGLVIRDMGFPR